MERFERDSSMIFSFYTLGCKANQFDTQAMEQIVVERGHTIVPFHEKWDVCVINSCTVTATADKKSRQVIRQAQRANPEGIIAVCGCYAQIDPQSAQDLNVDIIGGAVGKEEFIASIEQCYIDKQKKVLRTNLKSRVPFEVLNSGCLFGRTRALIKVQDGCDNYCTYCIIPYSRGHIRSMPIETAKEQIAKLEAEGYKETIVTGIEISSYGLDFPGNIRLIDLLEAMSIAAPKIRIRLGSLEPRTVTEEFCLRLSQLKNICKHFHLSMQSGCDDTLRRMKRKYDTARYFQSVELLRRYFPNCAITTDLITGFPEESEDEFAVTLNFIKQCNFSSMHIFPYSVRKGTPAAAMKQIEKKIKEKRAEQAISVAKQMKDNFLSEQIGLIHSVLFETQKNGAWRGYTETYLEVVVKSNKNLHNCVENVKITSVENDTLLGIIL